MENLIYFIPLMISCALIIAGIIYGLSIGLYLLQKNRVTKLAYTVTALSPIVIGTIGLFIIQKI